MKTKIINETTHTLIWKEGNAGIFRKLCELPPTETFTIVYNLNSSYREYWQCRNVGNVRDIVLSSDDISEAEEITIYETIDNTIAWRTSKARGSLKQPSASIQVSSTPDNYR